MTHDPRPAEVIAAELIALAARMPSEEVAARLVAEFEGFVPHPYKCPAGIWTIGFGRTSHEGGVPVCGEDQPCTREQAVAWLRHDLAAYLAEVNRLTVPLTVGQRAACASLAYNIGNNAFRNSTLRRHLAARNYEGAAEQFLRWNKGGGRVLPGLVKRRRTERFLFNGVLD